MANTARVLLLGPLLLSLSCGGSTTGPSNNTPPPPALSLTCPSAINTSSLNGAPLSIRYASATAVGGSAPVTIDCVPNNDSSFPTGTTTVTCTGTDSKGTRATCSFDIHVTAPGRVSMTNYTAFGDSITEGEVPSEAGLFKVQRLDFAKSYPGVLYGLLTARYGSQTISVANMGKLGEQTTDGIGRLPGAILSASQVLLLMEGTNDLGAVPSIPSISNLRTMVQIGKSRGQKVFLGTIPPEGTFTVPCPAPPRNSNIFAVPGFNQLVRDLASSEGVTLVDVYSALITNTSQYIDCDGLHPSPAGYQKIAETFFDAIKAAFETQAPASLPPGPTLSTLIARPGSRR